MKTQERCIDTTLANLFVEKINISNSLHEATLVFLHDALGCTEGWKDFPSKLCQLTGYNGIVYDRVGHGKSASYQGKRKTGYHEHEANVVLPAVLKEYNITDAILIGHSDGATIALIHEATFNNSRAVISISGHIMVEDVTIKGVEQIGVTFLNEQKLNLLKRYHKEKAKKLVGDWMDIWLSEEFKSWNISDQINKIKCPVLVIQGDKDEFATEGHVDTIIKSLKASTQVRKLLIDNCGHVPYKEHPELVLSEINSFIKQL